MTDIRRELFALADAEYAAFASKLAPTVSPKSFIGVRIPALRSFADKISKERECAEFLHSLPHTYYDENLLHSILLGKVGDYGECLALVREFLPYVDNWAVCDTLRPAAFAEHRDELIGEVRAWIASPHTYTCRFGLGMLMTHYLDADFRPEYLELAAAVESGEYYVRMMVAWYFATALAKQWDAAVTYIEQHRLPTWTHKKTIQKARESFRITDAQKEYLARFR